MESNGKAGSIHVSEDTAEALISRGKSDWVTPRTELVQAKGKGTMQTYWITVKSTPGDAMTFKSAKSIKGGTSGTSDESESGSREHESRTDNATTLRKEHHGDGDDNMDSLHDKLLRRQMQGHVIKKKEDFCTGNGNF